MEFNVEFYRWLIAIRVRKRYTLVSGKKGGYVMGDTLAIGRAIAQLRRAMKMTQQSLAACLYVSHQAVSKWENGVALPDVMTLYTLCKLFDISIEQLLTIDIAERLDAMRTAVC
jgi:DNA-binding XRE family transcriptional regulator